MYKLYYTKSGAPWSSKTLIWQSDMASDPEKYGIYDMKCSVEINKAGELKFVMAKGCSSYNLFKKERSVLTLIMTDISNRNRKTIFRGVVKLIETDLFFQRTITANSDLIYLSDSVFEPHGDDIEETPPKRFTRILKHHNLEMQGDPEKQIRPGTFDLPNIKYDDNGTMKYKTEKYTKNGGYKDTMSQLQNDFKDYYGFYNIRYNSDYSVKYLDLRETFVTNQSLTTQDIKFAVNIEDYQYQDTVDDLFTILIPVGGDNLTLKDQNATKTIAIRMPDQTTRNIQVYIVDKYIKIVEGLKKYGYIYLAESFTVDTNNIGASGINGTISGSWSGNISGGSSGSTSYIYTQVGSMLAGWNPAAMGLYYYSGGKYHAATETTAVPGRIYYRRKEVSTTTDGTEGDDGGGTYTYVAVSLSSADNPKSMGLYEKRAFTIAKYILTNDTKPLGGKTYYRRV